MGAGSFDALPSSSWAADYAPVVTFHPDERSLPCGIEDLLGAASLVDGSGTVISTAPTQELLAQYDVDGSDVHLVLDTPVPGGLSAPLYVVAQQPPGLGPDVVDLTFVLLFGANGPQAAQVYPAVSDEITCLLPHFGEHQGDLETMTVRVSGGDGDRSVDWVRFEAHGNDTFVLPGTARGLGRGRWRVAPSGRMPSITRVPTASSSMRTSP
jgi:hypothetical protein